METEEGGSPRRYRRVAEIFPISVPRGCSRARKIQRHYSSTLLPERSPDPSAVYNGSDAVVTTGRMLLTTCIESRFNTARWNPPGPSLPPPSPSAQPTRHRAGFPPQRFSPVFRIETMRSERARFDYFRIQVRFCKNFYRAYLIYFFVNPFLYSFSRLSVRGNEETWKIKGKQISQDRNVDEK